MGGAVFGGLGFISRVGSGDEGSGQRATLEEDLDRQLLAWAYLAGRDLGHDFEPLADRAGHVVSRGRLAAGDHHDGLDVPAITLARLGLGGTPLSPGAN